VLSGALLAFAIATYGAASGATVRTAAPPNGHVPNCFDTQTMADGAVTRRYRGDRRCVSTSEPREYAGIYRNDFEGSVFFAGATDHRAVPALRIEDQTWLNRTELLEVPAPCSPPTRFRIGHSYRIRFIGRHSRIPRQRGAEGYGHLGVFGNLIIVDRFLAIEDLGLRRDR
jgi:hypothetical protein